MDVMNFVNELKNNKQKLILAAVIAVVFVLFDISFLMKWQLKSIGASNQKIAKLKKDIGEVKKDLTLMRKTENEKDTVSGSKIYTEGEIPFLLQDISSLANENQIEVMQISQSKEIKKQEQVKAKAAKGKPAAKTEKKVEGFISVDIKLDLSCTYHDLGVFLDRLESAEQPLFASEMKIVRDSSNYMRQNVSLTLRTYVKK